MHQKKLQAKQVWRTRVKVKKVHFSFMFFGFIFLKLFQRIPNQREILCFLIPMLNFLIKIFFALICTFCTLWLQMRRKLLKKTENLFLWMSLRILLGNHQRVCITKLLKLIIAIFYFHKMSENVLSHMLLKLFLFPECNDFLSCFTLT